MAAESFFITVNDYNVNTREMKINYGTTLTNSKGIELNSTGGTCPNPGTYEDFVRGGSGIDLPGFLISGALSISISSLV